MKNQTHLQLYMPEKADGRRAGNLIQLVDESIRKCRSLSHEPGCRVLGAVDKGEISMDRLENYRKMKRELEYLTHRQHKSADRVEKERLKEIALKTKAMKKRK